MKFILPLLLLSFQAQAASPLTETVYHQAMTLGTERVPPQLQNKLLYGVVQIVQAKTNYINSMHGGAGSGFFLEGEFPILHSARHVLAALDPNLPIHLFYHDSQGREHHCKVKSPAIRLSSTMDEAWLDLRDTEIANHFDRSLIFKRATGPIQFDTPFYSAGFNADINVRIRDLMLIHHVHQRASLVAVAGRAGICVEYGVLKSLLESHPEENDLSSLDETLKAMLDSKWMDGKETPHMEDVKSLMTGAPVSVEVSEKLNIGVDLRHTFCGPLVGLTHGASGGPVMNAQGEIIGLISFASTSGGLFGSPDLTLSLNPRK